MRSARKEKPRLPWARKDPAVGATWGASKPGGLNMKEWLQPRNGVRAKVAARVVVVRRPICNMGKAEATWEETGESTTWGTGVRAQAPREGGVEITSRRPISQQGLAATCKDPPTEALTIGGGRDLGWRMSQYERRRRGNALRGGARRLPGTGNARTGQRGSGHLAVPGWPSDTEPS